MQKNPFRTGRVHTILHQAIAHFLREHANAEPFITISYIDLNKAGTTVTVYCSVFPKEQQEQALAFLKRKESVCREYLKKHTALRIAPTVRFTLAKEILP
ncbi:MAG: ribosome-binding factor A [Candidatus Kaiserbacteria bacterium]|nr:ribosome-binding factor A [Candidatus Kaiserbacteria bacterium]